MFEEGNQVWKGKQHTEETRRKMREAARRRWQIKKGVLPMPAVPEKKVRGWHWKGRKHTEESRRKMSAAHSNRGRRKDVPGTPEEGYRLLITAVIGRALKDNEVGFFNTDTGKYYCDFAGVDPVKLLKKHNMCKTQHSGQFAIEGHYDV